jgi:predicted metalloprotease
MPSAIKLFTQPTATPCGGAQPTAGPFYCGRDGLVSFDLQFIHMVQTKLAAEADEATVVLVGQTVAAKVQQSLGGFSPVSVRPGDVRAAGVARQADCLAGVWARRAQQALPKATPELYGRLLLAERSVVQGMQGDERLLPASHTLIMEGEIADRESAYERGYAAGQQGSCPAT